MEPEVLEGFKDLPAGFRRSTLGTNYSMGIGHASNYLIPELKSNGIGFKDLHFDKKNQVQKRTVKCNLSFGIAGAKCIPAAGNIPVLGRHVRMALFDKSNILSNIHSVPATLHPDNEDVWIFSSKVLNNSSVEYLSKGSKLVFY